MDKGIENDIDDIMAEIMSGVKPVQATPLPVSKPDLSAKAFQHKPSDDIWPFADTHVQSAKAKIRSVQYQNSKQQENPHKPHQIFKTLAVTLLILVSLVGLGLLSYTQIDTVLALFQPPSPFTEELKQKVSYPLYYPSKLPEGFQMELGSISQPEDGIVVYKVSDESGKNMTISEQARNDNINFDSIFTPEVTVDKFELPNGKAYIGTTKDGQVVAHFITDKTWLILSAGSSTANTDNLKLIFGSLKTS